MVRPNLHTEQVTATDATQRAVEFNRYVLKRKFGYG